MTDRCPDSATLEAWAASEPPAAARPHLDACPSCREQLAADRSLRSAFAGMELPALSPGFTAELRHRHESLVVRPLEGQRKRWMIAYWTLFALATLGVVGWFLTPVMLEHPLAWWLAVMLIVPASFVATLNSPRVRARLLRWVSPLLA